MLLLVMLLLMPLHIMLIMIVVMIMVMIVVMTMMISSGRGNVVPRSGQNPSVGAQGRSPTSSTSPNSTPTFPRTFRASPPTSRR